MATRFALVGYIHGNFEVLAETLDVARRLLPDPTQTPQGRETSRLVRGTSQIPVDTHHQTRQERRRQIQMPTMRRQNQNQRQDPQSQQKVPTRSTLCCQHRRRIRILLSGHHHHPRRRTRHLPAHPLRHPRLEKTVRQPGPDREPQQPRQERRRPQRRLVPGARPGRLQLRAPRSANRSQPAPTQQLRPRRPQGRRRRTAAHPHH